MRILQVNKFNYLRGGADKYFIDISESLKEAGHKVAVFCMKHPENKRSEYENYFVSRVSFNENLGLLNKLKIPGRIIYSLEAKYKFKKLVKDFKPDIIHLHNIYHHLSPSIISVAKKNNIPVVMHLHDYKLICPNHTLFVDNNYCDRCLERDYLNCFKNKCSKNSYLASLLLSFEMFCHHRILKIYEKGITFFIAPSLFMKNICSNLSWTKDRIFLIYNPYSQEFKDVDSSLQTENYLLYFGRLGKEKGVDSLIRASIKTASNLKIVGIGEEEFYLKKIAQEENETNTKIEFLGFKKGRELREIIMKSRAVVMPSVWAENMPLSLLEAMSLKKIVIASRIGGFTEMIEDGVNGFFFEPANVQDLSDKIKKLASCDLASFGLKAQEKVASLDSENNLKEVLSVYNKALKKFSKSI